MYQELRFRGFLEKFAACEIVKYFHILQPLHPNTILKLTYPETLFLKQPCVIPTGGALKEVRLPPTTVPRTGERKFKFSNNM